MNDIIEVLCLLILGHLKLWILKLENRVLKRAIRRLTKQRGRLLKIERK
jgi:hypothetical protein